MTHRSRMIAVGAVLALVAFGALVRNPVRKMLKPKPVPSRGRFDNPEGLAIDSAGSVYVGNQNTGKFMVLDRSGKTVKEWTSLEGYTNGAGAPGGFCRGLYIRVPEPGRVIQT